MRPPGSLPEDVADEIFSDWTAPRRRGAVPSFFFSLAVHATVVAVAWQINPTPSAKEFKAPTVEQILAESNRRVVWYSPKAALPEVAPVEQQAVKAEAETPRYRLPQRVNANDPNPQSTRQMIVSDAPEIEIQQDLDLPNMLSWKAPEVERPRFQLEQPKLVAPSERTMAEITPPKAPQIEMQLDQPQVDAAKLQQLARLRFQREQELNAPEPERQALTAEAAPELALNAQAPELDASRFQQTSRLRYQGTRQTAPAPAPTRQALAPGESPVISTTPTTRAGINPAEFQRLARLRYQAGEGTPRQDAPQAQALGAGGLPAPVVTNTPDGGPGVNAAEFQQLSRLRYQGPAGERPAGPGTGPRALGDLTGGAAPSVSAATSAGGANEELARAVSSLNRLEGPGAPPPSLGAPGGDQSGGTGGDENLVVAGVNPSNRIPDNLPKGSRRGSFSAGPNATADGGRTGSAGSDSARLRVPGLAVEGPNNATQRSTLPGQGGPADDLNAMLRRGGLRNTAGPPPEVEIVWDPRQIDLENPFVGRPVYKTAINMPNVTSYRGDWVIQFAEYDEEQSKKRRGAPTKDIEDRATARPEGIEPPYPKIKVDPKYVREAARDLIEGEVIVYGIIQPSGSITNITLLKSVDDKLDLSAQEALAKWKFEPARKDGKAVAVEALVRIPFRLDPSVKVRY